MDNPIEVYFRVVRSYSKVRFPITDDGRADLSGLDRDGIREVNDAAEFVRSALNFKIRQGR